MTHEEDKLDLVEIYKDLKNPPLLMTKHIKNLFKKFSFLLGLKPSFASHTHKIFSQLINK